MNQCNKKKNGKPFESAWICDCWAPTKTNRTRSNWTPCRKLHQTAFAAVNFAVNEHTFLLPLNEVTNHPFSSLLTMMNSPTQTFQVSNEAHDILNRVLNMAKLLKQLGLQIDDNGKIIPASQQLQQPLQTPPPTSVPGTSGVHQLAPTPTTSLESLRQYIQLLGLGVGNGTAALSTVSMTGSRSSPSDISQSTYSTIQDSTTSSKITEDAQNLKRPSKNNRRDYHHESFPQKLHRLVTALEEDGRDDIISFTGDDTPGFFLNQPEEFEQNIMPKFFRGRKLSTFRRQLVFYGFFRQRKGPLQGAFVNPHFVRGKPELIQHIVRDDRYDDASPSKNFQTKALNK